uniref:nucleoside triphosphate pyrophosphohydrolase n=1 Tax=uncultured Acinetobacter sp. TaxID=165433 RepID=UPI00262D112F|nr:nucleoside triphosphate pyrophosphohydrolase [uncultured Acinetobacter sp.]
MQDLLDLMQTLRRECPWDQKQTPESLTKYAIEEAYEVDAAVRSGDVAHVKEELGDLLLQVVFQSQLYSEQGAFDFQDVVDTLKEKLIRRHPHVFDPNFQHLDEAGVNQLWQQIKALEKQQQQKPISRLDKVKVGASIDQAQKIQQYAATLNFDWADVDGAWIKLNEELQELREAMKANDIQHIQEELGDCLFAMINVGRKLDQNCDQALHGTIAKFRNRFAYIEQALAQKDLTPEQCDLVQLDQLWDEAKAHERQ